MSVIITEMDMPKDCGECDLRVTLRFKNNLINFCPKTMKNVELNELHNECPLSEIPTPHGRLIDADKLLKSIDIMRELRCKTCSSRIDTKHCDRNGCWMIFISDFIGSLPTIIEAENESEAINSEVPE